MNTFLKVKSSNIQGLSYDKTTQNLKVLFASGTVYEYSDVTLEQFTAIYTAPSVGKYMNKNIKGNHEYKKVEEVKVIGDFKAGKYEGEGINFVTTHLDYAQEYMLVPCEYDHKLYSGQAPTLDGDLEICLNCGGTGIMQVHL